MSSKGLSPQRPSPDLADRQQRSGVFGIPRGHAPPWLEGPEGVFHPMPPRIPLRVVGADLLAMAAGRDHRDHPLRPSSGHDRIAVVTPVRYENLCFQARRQVQGLGTVCSGSLGQSPLDGGRPCASAARCHWEFSPLWCAPSAGCRPARRRRGDGPSDMAGVDHQRRTVRCVPHCRPQSSPHAPIAPPAAAAMRMLPVAGVGGRSRHGAPVRRIPNTAFRNRRWSAAGRPTLPGPPGSRGSRRGPTRGPRGRGAGVQRSCEAPP